MSSIRVAHIGDVHYADKFLEEVDRCMNFAIDYMQRHAPDLIVIPGDTFDHRLEQNSPALFAAIDALSRLANIAPVVVLQGTLSHDAPHAIDIFMSIQALHEICVVNRIRQIALVGQGFREFTGEIQPGTQALISCLPSINKGQVAAAVGAENAAHAVGEHVADLLKSWAPSNLSARAADIPTIFMTHGTVSGSVTEHGCPMMGLDHELTSGAAFATQASAGMINHIHKHQAWEKDGRLIAYPGSLGRLHFGEHDPKGFLVWEVDAHGATFEFIPTPARELLEVTFPGSPDMDELARIAGEAPAHAHVRIRYVLDEEHRASVDKAAMAALFAHCAETKIEGRIAPVQRQRAAGISRHFHLREQLEQWCQHTGTEFRPLADRLDAIAHGTTDDIMEAMA